MLAAGRIVFNASALGESGWEVWGVAGDARAVAHVAVVGFGPIVARGELFADVFEDGIHGWEVGGYEGDVEFEAGRKGVSVVRCVGMGRK